MKQLLFSKIYFKMNINILLIYVSILVFESNFNNKFKKKKQVSNFYVTTYSIANLNC